MRSLLTFVFALFVLESLGQPPESIRPQNVKIASPNAASLGKVADIPISYHTGIPNIDIPIYTVQEGPLKLPISLSYHASGLRVAEQSSWVGAGWSLNCGGMITRAVRGMPDEVKSSSGSPVPISYLSSRGYYDYLFMETSAGGEYSPQIVPNTPNGLPQVLAYVEFASNRRDGEADMFNFNFNGYSGKFYFKPDNSVVLAPQQDIRVQPLLCPDSNPNCNPSNEYLYGWIVTTPDGVRYYFGKALDQAGNYNTTTNVPPLEYTTSYSYTSGLSYTKTASSWYLNKIESADKKFSISIVYSAEKYSYYTTSLFPQASYNSAPLGIDLVKNIMSGVRVNSIKFSNNGLVSLIPSTFMRKDLSGDQTNFTDYDPDSTAAWAPRALGEIQISNSPTTTSCQSFVFSYGYFSDASHALTGYLAPLETPYNIHSDKKRLKLKSITERACDGSIVKPPHTFSYFDEASVPRTLSFGYDHWGYFNGQTGNTTPLPALSINNGWTNLSASYGYGNRESQWPHMRAGTLEKIIYPTGGSTRLALKHHLTTIPVTTYDSTYIGNLSANYTQTAGPVSFTITPATQYLKVRVSLPYSPNGQGNIKIINTSSGFDYGFASNSNGVTFIQVPAGSYQFSVQSTSNNSYPIMATLYKISSSLSTQDAVVGGLRVDSLIYRNGLDAVERIQRFTYTNASGQQQGVLFSKPAYISILKNDATKDHGGVPGAITYNTLPYSSVNGCTGGIGEPNNPSQYVFYVSANSILPMTTSQGSHFGYNQVRVTELNGSYTVYEFKPETNPVSDVCVRVVDTSQCPSTLPNYPPAPEAFKPDRGELAIKSVYNSAGNLLHKEVYTNIYSYEMVGTMGLIVKPWSTFYFPTEYEWKSGRKTSAIVESYTYDATTPAAPPVYKKTSTFYESERHTQPTRIKVEDSFHVLHEVKSTYVGDVVVPGCQDLNAQLSGLDISLYTTIQSDKSTYNYDNCATSPCRLQNWLLYTYYANLHRKLNTFDPNNSTNRVSITYAYKDCMKGITANWPWSGASASLKALVKLKTRNQISPVIESSQWRDGNFMGSEYITYQDFAGDTVSIYPGRYDVMKVGKPSASSVFTPVAISNTAVTLDSDYTLEETYSFAFGNMVQVSPKSGVPSSYIWNSFQTYPVAEVKNAAEGSAAFTSFEESANEGGWTFTATGYTDYKTGVKSHSLNGNSVSRTGLTSSASYKLTYWAKGGTPTLSGGVVASNDAAAAEPDGWKYFEKTISGVTSITMSGTSGVYLDELRIYPDAAQMTTYTYKPLTGIISSSDPNNRSSYFDYDNLGRLWLVKDPYRNILKQYKYNYRTGPSPTGSPTP